MKDRRTTENGHFDLRGYLQWSGIIENYDDELAGLNVLIMMTPRDIGKSTGGWNYTLKEYVPQSNYEKKFAYFRNKDTQIKKFTAGFNAKYFPDYQMSSSTINRTIFGENGKLIEKKMVGMMNALSCYEGAKSAITDGFHLIFWDEFNEDDEQASKNWQLAKLNRKLYSQFLDLLKTFERHRNDVTVLVMGNKVSTENDILLKLDIVDDENATDDQLFIRDKVIDGKLVKIRVVIAHDDTFKICGSKATIANALASFDEDTNRYLNKGGFLINKTKDVKSWVRIREDAIPWKHLCFDNYFFELGYLGDEDSEEYYIHEINDSRLNQDIPLIALDTHSYIVNTRAESLFSEQDYVDFFEFLSYNLKYKKLVFTTNFAKNAMLEVMKRSLTLTEV